METRTAPVTPHLCDALRQSKERKIMRKRRGRPPTFPQVSPVKWRLAPPRNPLPAASSRSC
eukprot:6816861-Lingulodinium_polyedra.AAC.1